MPGAVGQGLYPRSHQPGGEDADAFVEITDILLHCLMLVQMETPHWQRSCPAAGTGRLEEGKDLESCFVNEVLL